MGETEFEIDAKLLVAQSGWLRALALRLVGDEGQAQELAQETLGQAWLAPPRGADEEPVLRAWLARVLRNQAFLRRRDRARRARREAQAARPEAQDEPQCAVELAEHSRRLLAAVMGLEEPYRSTVLLRYYEGLNAVEIAQRTGVQPTAIRKRLSRALTQLRSTLDADQGGHRKDWSAALFVWANAPQPGASALGSSLTLGGLGMTLKAVGVTLALGLVVGGVWWARTEDPGLEVPAPAQVVQGEELAQVTSEVIDALVEGQVGEAQRVLDVPEMRTPEAAADVASVRVHGRVASSAGGVLEGGRVEVRWAGSAGYESAAVATPDGAGNYEVYLTTPPEVSPHVDPKRIVRVRATALGHMPGNEVSQVPSMPSQDGARARPEVRVDFTLDSGPVGQGLVVDGKGSPVPDAKVWLLNAEGASVGTAETDHHGAYSMLLPGVGSYDLTGRAFDVGTGSVAVPHLDGKSDVRLPELALRELGTLEGQVVLPTGEPLGGIEVRAVNRLVYEEHVATRPGREIPTPEETRQGQLSAFTWTDAAGAFRIGGLCAGSYVLSVWTEPEEIETPFDQWVTTGTHDIRLEVEVYRVRVTTRDGAGRPLPNAELWVASEDTILSTRSGPRGQFESFVAPGPIVIQAQVDGVVAVREALEMAPPNYLQEIELRLDFDPQTGSVQFDATDTQGRPTKVDSVRVEQLLEGTEGPSKFLWMANMMWPDAQGHLDLPVGSYFFRADYGENMVAMHFPSEGTFEVKLGQRTLVPLRPKGGGMLELLLDQGAMDKHVAEEGLVVELEPFGQESLGEDGDADYRMNAFRSQSEDGGMVFSMGPLLNGQPQWLKLVPAGPHVLRIRGKNIATIERDVQLEAGQVFPLALTLQPAND